MVDFRRRIGRVGFFTGWPLRLTAVCFVAASVGSLSLTAEEESPVATGEAQWIWTPTHDAMKAPTSACYFRKHFSLENPESGRVEITADDAYELFVNGRLVGGGESWQQLDVYDIERFLISGRNTIAVKATNSERGPAGLVARVIVKNQGNTDVSHSSDASWLVSTKEQSHWQHGRFDDSKWKKARALGELGRTEPWNDEIKTAQGASPGRFQVPPQFVVEQVIDPDDCGSLVAMTFDEQGAIIASREGGPLLRISDSDGDQVPDEVKVLCEELKNCQGMLCLNGDIYAVGEGPEKTGFYHLSGRNEDGTVKNIQLLFRFRGGMGEHGPHAPILGPDGMIYLVVGNHSGVEGTPFAPSSPHQRYYPGDLVQPRYEDAGGHAHGVKVPAGTVIRTDVEGKTVELFAGGFRNAYDIAFNRQGDLFTYDSDMEWDEGLPWYRPTRVNHIVPGGEYGWRSGWAKWPAYYLDSLPAVVDIGRGSPTGVIAYNHRRYPVRYHNALFVGDWSLGRILAIKMRPEDGTYVARAEVFMLGKPLNVTDLDVGPDGWLYFATGGRGTEGGVYRVRYKGNIPPQPALRGVMQAVRQPQFESAWGRDQVAALRTKLGNDWDAQIRGVVQNPRMPIVDRVRALELMLLVGPIPEAEFLARLSRDAQAELRTKAAYSMGLYDDPVTDARLVELLDDPDAGVRRVACEALVRCGHEAPAEKLVQLLGDRSRFVAWAARRALERQPADRWHQLVLDSDNVPIVLRGLTGLLIQNPNRDTAMLALEECRRIMTGFVSDGNFIGLLRVLELALHLGEIPPDEVPELRATLAEEYPALEPRMNRELLRLLVYLQEPTITTRMFEELRRSDNPRVERLHIAFHGRFMEDVLTLRQKLELLSYYEYARTLPGGHSFSRYVDNVLRDFVGDMSGEERQAILDHGTDLPSAALQALFKLEPPLSDETIQSLIELDRQLLAVEGEPAEKLATGILAVLGESGSPEAIAHVREVFQNQPDRRQDAAVALAQHPGGENWPLLIEALPIVEEMVAQEVLAQLLKVDRAPEGPEPLRQVILAGLKLKQNQRAPAVQLLRMWTGQRPDASAADTAQALAAWQAWFRQEYPNQPDPVLPSESEENKWTYDELLAYLSSSEAAHGNVVRGQDVFRRAKCFDCHRYGSEGEGIGPDLTTVSRRFHIKQILESVLFPSQVISDQYASKTVVTVDGKTYTGIVGSAGEDAIVVLQSDGKKEVIEEDDIDEIVPSKKSTMPEGLFNTLSMEEIADLFAFISQPPNGRTAAVPASSAGRRNGRP